MRIDPYSRRPRTLNYRGLNFLQGTLGGLGNGTALDFSALQQIASAAGFPDADAATAAGIALAESSGNPAAIGDRALAPEKGPSYGLWQINLGSKAHPEFASWNLLDPQVNAAAAFQIYARAGASFREWSTYSNGAFLKFMNAAPAPPVTIDAATGQVVEDNTPTPSVTVDGIPVLGLTAAAIGALLLAALLK